MSKYKRAEIDVDGVLANLDGSYAPYVRKYIPDFSEAKYVHSWGMENIYEISKEAYDTIHKLWIDPKFMGRLPRFPRVKEGFALLNAVPNLEIVIHTHLLTDGPVVEARERWIKMLEKEVGGKFTIDICCGKSKQMMTDSEFVVEDSVRNLNASFAPKKFLVRRCHNASFSIKDIRSVKESYIVPDFYTAASIIYGEMTGKLIVTESCSC